MATVYYTVTTLDGFLATADHSLDWLFAVEHRGQFVTLTYNVA